MQQDPQLPYFGRRPDQRRCSPVHSPRCRGPGPRRAQSAFACRKAGVEPVFKTCDPDADPLSVVVSLNVKRRNLNAGQKAIAAADAWLQGEAEGRVQVGPGRPKKSPQNAEIIRAPAVHFAKVFGVGEKYVEMGRDLLRDDPVAAAAVRDGPADLRKAHYDLGLRLGQQNTRASHLRKLTATSASTTANPSPFVRTADPITTRECHRGHQAMASDH